MSKPPKTIYEPGKSWGIDPNAEINRDLGGCGQGCAVVVFTVAVAILCLIVGLAHGDVPTITGTVKVQSTTPVLGAPLVTGSGDMGTITTIWVGGSIGGGPLVVAPATNFVICNGRPPVFVVSADTPMPGQRIKFLAMGQPFAGVWLKGGLILLNSGQIVSDNILPRIAQLSGIPGQLDSSATPPAPPVEGANP